MIENIYREETYFRSNFNYNGTLRNEFRFDIGDNIFFSPIGENAIYRGEIYGVEKTNDINPGYIYKIYFSENPYNQIKGKTEVKCDRIFRNIEDAKKSAKSNLLANFKLQRDSIERYFNQFK